MRAGFGAWNPPFYPCAVTGIDYKSNAPLSPSSARIPDSVLTDSEYGSFKMASIDAFVCQEFCNACCCLWAEFDVPLSRKNSPQPPSP